MNQENIAQVMNDPLLRRSCLNSNIPARLAYTGLDGFPRAIPIGFPVERQAVHHRYRDECAENRGAASKSRGGPDD